VASGNPPSRGALFSPDLLKNTANTTAACSYCTTHRGRYSAAVSPRTLTPASSLPDRMRTDGYRQPPLASSSCCHCWHLADHVRRSAPAGRFRLSCSSTQDEIHRPRRSCSSVSPGVRDSANQQFKNGLPSPPSKAFHSRRSHFFHLQ
jgi:hypothetical protein